MIIIKPKAVLRTHAKYDLQSAVIGAVANVLENEPVYRSCMNCFRFNEHVELCNLCNMRPPARIIAYGCPKWEDIEDIPF